jgi:hypothetical protein
VRHGVKGATPHLVQRLVRRRRALKGYAPSWLRPEYARRHIASYDPWAWKRCEGPLWWRAQAHQLTSVRELLDAHGYVRRRAAQVDLDARHPFMHDLDLVELALRLPPEPRFDPDHDRILLRRAMAGRLPDSVRLRRAKPVFSGLLGTSLAGPDGTLLRGLLLDQRAEMAAYVRPQALERDLLRIPRERHPSGPAGWDTELWRLGSTEVWLRSLGDPGFLDELAQRSDGGGERARPGAAAAMP